MIFGLPRIDSINLYEGCIYGKQTKKFSPLKKLKELPSRTNSCSFMWTTKSLSGSIYFLLFIDDCMNCVYCL